MGAFLLVNCANRAEKPVFRRANRLPRGIFEGIVWGSESTRRLHGRPHIEILRRTAGKPATVGLLQGTAMIFSADMSTILNRILDTAADNLRVAKILIQLGLDPNNVTYDALINRLLEIFLQNITLRSEEH